MRIPQRRSELYKKYGRNDDHHLSADAIRKLNADLRRLETARPRALEDLTRAREMGDLSENAAYSEAKGRLAGIDRRIFEIKEKLKNAILIERGTDDGRIGIGATVAVEVGGKRRTYEITGSQETDPGSGKISHLSPLGAALVGHAAGDTVVIIANGKKTEYRILDVK